MSIKKTCFVHSIISIMLGALIYYLFRPNAVFLSPFLISSKLIHYSFCGDWIIQYYLADFLWSYSLCFSLLGLHTPSYKKSYFCFFITAAFGLLWELAQHFHFVSGTADIFDFVAYCTGSLSALCIYYFIKRRKL